MRCQSGLVRAVVLMATFAAGGAWAQGETQIAAPPPSPLLDSMPHWSEFPVPPKDVPSAAVIKQRVEAQVALRDQLQTEYSALTWDPFNPDALSAAARAKIDPALLTPVDTPMTADQLQSLGATLRAKAAPPPVAN